MKFIIAAQSHVAVSFEQPEYTANSDAGGFRILEAIRILKLEKKTNIIKPLPLNYMEL